MPHSDPPAPPGRSTRNAGPRGLPFLLVLALFPRAAVAQDPGAAAQADTLPATPPREAPADTYADVEVRALMERARVARSEVAEGLETYEARLRERVYFGVSGDIFRRERGIFDQERVSRVRWSRDGNHVIRWEGARLDIPIAGLSSTDDPNENIGQFLVRNLSGINPDGDDDPTDPVIPPPLAYDPASDRIFFGPDWVLNPLADTAVHQYRFQSGDTLSITLPGTNDRVVLAEVRVQPRFNDFRLVSASLWFDLATAALVRAGYRPARPFDLELDAADDDDLPPGFLRPIRAEIRYVTMDHGLFDLQFWIPRRATFEGEGQVAAFARFPITIEWTMDQILPNELSDLIPDVIPEGWILREAEVERDDEIRSITVLVPTAQELARSPELTMGTPSSASAFTPDELGALERTLAGLAAPTIFPGVRFAYGLQEGLTRYNRVEGLSTGVSATLPLPRLEIRAEARIGLADGEPGGELRVRRGSEVRSEELAVYRRLDSSSEWVRPNALATSLASALWGTDFTPFHRAWGVEGVLGREGRFVTGELRLFWEAQDTAVRETHAHLARLWTDRDLPENPMAAEGSWGGAALHLAWDAGRDPRGVRGFGSVRLEGAGGTSSYGRGWTSAGLTFPLLRRWTGAIEAGIGSSTGTLPPQRSFYPGGPAVFRGAEAGRFAGEAFWFGRAEIGTSLPAIRLVGFADALSVGSRSGFTEGKPEVAVGAGISLLDGIFRLDVARNLRGTKSWKLLLYLDGLF
ncbi:MAG: hypothetical protein WEG36_14695 [Gemmatimonadota bacterium]